MERQIMIITDSEDKIVDYKNCLDYMGLNNRYSINICSNIDTKIIDTVYSNVFFLLVGANKFLGPVIQVLSDNKKEYKVINSRTEFADVIPHILAIDRIKFNREYVAFFHVDHMDGYFERAESDSHLSIFWNTDTVFYRMFSLLDLSNVVELACGRGRHVQKYIDKAEHVMLVDILDENITFCKERFKNNDKISYYKNDGYDLKKLEDETYSALFTYDAMVHFELMDIYSYLVDIYRILKLGGRALFHHSNNYGDYKKSFANDAGGRNFMSKEIFAYLSYRAGFSIVEQTVIDWAGRPGLDCLTLVEKN